MPQQAVRSQAMEQFRLNRFKGMSVTAVLPSVSFATRDKNVSNKNGHKPSRGQFVVT